MAKKPTYKHRGAELAAKAPVPLQKQEKEKPKKLGLITSNRKKVVNYYMHEIAIERVEELRQIIQKGEAQNITLPYVVELAVMFFKEKDIEKAKKHLNKVYSGKA